MFALGDQRPHNRIRKRLPPVALMRARAMRRHGQRSVEKKNALVGPTQQIRHSLSSVSRLKSSSILRQLFRDVDERRRCLNLRRDIERETLSLTGLVVRILSEDHDLHLVERGAVEGVEDELRGRKAPFRRIGPADEVRKVDEVLLLELRSENTLPALLDLNVHPDLPNRAVRSREGRRDAVRPNRHPSLR